MFMFYVYSHSLTFLFSAAFVDKQIELRSKL